MGPVLSASDVAGNESDAAGAVGAEIDAFALIRVPALLAVALLSTAFVHRFIHSAAALEIVPREERFGILERVVSPGEPSQDLFWRRFARDPAVLHDSVLTAVRGFEVSVLSVPLHL